MITVSQFSEYTDNEVLVDRPVQVTLENLDRAIYLFDILWAEDYEVLVYVDGDTQPIRPSGKHDNGGFKPNSFRGHIALPVSKIDAVVGFRKSRLRVVWSPLNSSNASEMHLDVVLSIEAVFDGDACQGGVFEPSLKKSVLTLFGPEPWQDVGEILVNWHPKLEQFFGRGDDLEIELRLQNSSFPEVVEFRLISCEGAPLKASMNMSDWRRTCPSGRFVLQARQLGAAPEKLASSGEIGFRLSIHGTYDDRTHDLAYIEETVALSFGDAADIINFWFETLAGDETEPEEVALSDRSTRRFVPVIHVPEVTGAPTHLFVFRWASTVVSEEIYATLGSGLQFVDRVGNRSREVGINQGVGSVAVIALPGWDQRTAELTFAARNAQGPIAVVEPNFEFTVLPAPDPVVAVDIGTSSLCVAYARSGQGVEFVKLAKFLKRYDPDHLEAGTQVGDRVPDALVSSTVGVFTDGDSKLKHWRKSEMPASTWWRGSQAEPSAVEEDAIEATQQQNQRENSGLEVSVPFAKARNLLWGTGDGSLIAQNLKMQALSRRKTAVLTTLGTRSESAIPSILVTDLYCAIFKEIAAVHLPWSDSLPSMQGGTLVLSHPNRFSESDFGWMMEAASSLRIALGVDQKNVLLVTEGRAALQYAAAEYAGKIRELGVTRNGTPARLMVFDFGAGTLDVTMGEVKIDGPREDMVRELASVGASVGGNAIDLILYFMLHDRLKELEEKGTIAYETPLVVDNPLSLQEGRSAFEARRAVRLAIDRAKKELNAAIMEHRSTPSRSEPSFVIAIEVGRSHRAVAQINNHHQDEIAIENGSIGPGAGRRSLLKIPFTLSDVANYPPMQKLVSFIVKEVPEVLKHQAGDGPEFVALTGRASLWPPLRDAFSQAFHDLDSPLCNAVWLDEGSSVDHLKSAVVEGAINVARNYYGGSSLQNHSDVTAFGVLSRRRSGMDFTPEGTGESLRLVGNDEVSVIYPLGLEEFSLERPDWRLSLLLDTKVGEISTRPPSVSAGGLVRTGLNQLLAPEAEPIAKPTREIDPSGKAMAFDDAPPGYIFR